MRGRPSLSALSTERAAEPSTRISDAAWTQRPKLDGVRWPGTAAPCRVDIGILKRLFCIQPAEARAASGDPEGSASHGRTSGVKLTRRAAAFRTDLTRVTVVTYVRSNSRSLQQKNLEVLVDQYAPGSPSAVRNLVSLECSTRAVPTTAAAAAYTCSRLTDVR